MHTRQHNGHDARLSRCAQSDTAAVETRRLVIQVPRFVVRAEPGQREVHFCYKGLMFRAIPVAQESDGWLVRDPIGVDERQSLWFSFTEQYVKLKGRAISDVSPACGGEA